MTVSVIVPTYNGEKKINGILEALAAQVFSDFELIVAIDGSTDQTEVLVGSYSDRFKALRTVSQKNKGRATIRNLGAREARGELLIFFDDDMIPNPRAVENHLLFHQSSIYDVIICGSQIENDEKCETDIQKYKAWLTQKWTRGFANAINPIRRDNLFLTAANLSLKKSLFLKLGGFDERLRDIEDYEFAVRALKQNTHIFFDKENIAFHNDPITCMGYINRVRTYTVAQKHLRILIPDVLSEIKRYGFIKRIFYKFFSLKLWPYLIDHSKLLMIIPKRIRYKFYEWIIFSQGVLSVNQDKKPWG